MEDFIKKGISFDELVDYASNLIFNDDVEFDEAERDLIATTAHYLDNLNEAMFPFSKENIKFLLKILKTVKTQNIALDWIEVSKNKENLILKSKKYQDKD